MSNNTKLHHNEPLIRLSKKTALPGWKAWAIRLGAFLFAVLFCAVIILILTGSNPIEVYRMMFSGSFGTSRKFWNMLQSLAMLLIVSVAVTPAFKMRFWNIGAEGHVLAGALGTAAVMIYCGGKLPAAVVYPLMVVTAVVCGMIWAVIPAIFKALYNTNETLFTLMMNYVATQLVAYLIVFWEKPKGSNVVGTINNPYGDGDWFPAVFGQKSFISIAVVLAITIAMFVYLKYSKHGYEISVVGESENTARYIGINVKKVILRTMLLSGAICGIAGLLLVAGTSSQTISTATAGGRGFTAIMVSWLAKFNPIEMILTSFILVFFERGAGEISSELSQSFASILTGIVLFCIIGSEFFINYKINFRKRHKEDKGGEAA